MKEALRAFVAEYGERGELLLRAMLEEARSSSAAKLGDFSFKGLRNRLKVMGIEYNPAPLLMKLEKEIGIIETSYRSSTQRWWKIVDKHALEEVLGVEELSIRGRLLRAQLHTLNPRGMAETLRGMMGRKLSEVDRARLRKIAFEELPLLVKVIEEARALGEEALEEEIRAAEEVLELFELVVTGARGALAEGPSLRHPLAEP
ncbi:MAG: hypothetical protein NZ902_05010 [Acidilobaceae archaeon]|nr:hypothetical protein [Acidilobaceae archaeon]MCX8165928.1 hypothetical protein [Acidilobaceae archaeon]MDW7974571.1 hypothetical protein [Sulfolobales archaeon]